MYISYSTHYIKPCSTNAETGHQQIRKRASAEHDISSKDADH